MIILPITMDIPQDAIIEVLKNIDTVLRKEQKINLSLMNGSLGSAMFLYYYSAFFKSGESAGACEKLTDKIITKLNNSEVLSNTYSDGLTGVFQFLNFMGTKLERYSDLLDVSYDNQIANSMFADFQRDEYDFMHGAIGGMNYFLHRYHAVKDKDHKEWILGVLQAGLDHLLQVRKTSKEGVFWNYPILDNPEVEEKICANIGFAHGTPGIVALLANMASSNICQEKIVELLPAIINYILHTRNLETVSQFPHYYSNEYAFAYKSPLAWCYGDLGVSLALLKAGRVLKNESIVNSAIDIALKTCHRKSVKSSSIFDSGFCHGTAGAVHAYDILYKSTSIESFRDSRNYWLDKTIAYSKFSENSLAGFRTYSGEGYWDKSAGLLTGISGIGLVLINLLGAGKDWDSFFLLGDDH